MEAILDVLDTYDDSENCKLDVIHYGVGAVSESDVELASTFNGNFLNLNVLPTQVQLAVIYAFNVTVSPAIAQLAKSNKVEIKKQNIIYKLIDDLKEVISSKLPPKQVEEIIGMIFLQINQIL